jgi:Putative transposase DNA-binding domain/Rhomboid family
MLFTSMFLHGGWAHLLGNMLFLWVFGSQDCSGCGRRVRKSLSVRTHVCLHCGLILDRDHTAAMVMLQRGWRWPGRTDAGHVRRVVGLVPWGTGNLTLGDSWAPADG